MPLDPLPIPIPCSCFCLSLHFFTSLPPPFPTPLHLFSVVTFSLSPRALGVIFRRQLYYARSFIQLSQFAHAHDPPLTSPLHGSLSTPSPPLCISVAVFVSPFIGVTFCRMLHRFQCHFVNLLFRVPNQSQSPYEDIGEKKRELSKSKCEYLNLTCN